MKNEFIISVIIVTKNRKHFLERSIDSVLSQSIKPLELIVIDDNSNIDERITDKTIQAYKDLTSIDLIISFNECSMGGNFSRNKGAKIARGNILMFLDDDDFWLPNKIKQQVNYFKMGFEFVYTGKKFVFSNDLKHVYRKSNEKSAGNDIWRGNYVGSTSGVAIDKQIFFLAGGFDEDLYSLQDYDLWIRVLKISEACWDGEHNLIYTVHANRGEQVTSNTAKHFKSIAHIKYKYAADINMLSFLSKRYFLSRMNYLIARAYRRANNPRFVIFYLKSLFLFPSLRTLLLPFFYR